MHKLGHVPVHIEAMPRSGQNYVLTEQQKWRIVEMFNKGMKKKAIATECTCIERAVSRWVKRFQATADVTSKPKPGRRPVLTPEMASKALDLLKEGQHSGARSVAVHMKAQGDLPRVVSKSTIIKHAKLEAGRRDDELVVRQGLPRKGLTQATKEKRLLFAQMHQNTDWDQVMFSDRKRFNFRFPGTAVRYTRWFLKSQQKAEEAGIYQPNHPSCLNIYVGITRHGATRVHLVEVSTGYKHNMKTKKGQKARNITAEEYRQVVQDTFLEGGKVLFQGQEWVLQQDNDPTHKVAGEIVTERNTARQPTVKVLAAWPPNSPDLNLIENF